MGLLSSIKSVASKVVSAVKSVVAPSAVKSAPAPAPAVNKVVALATPKTTALTSSLPKTSTPSPSKSVVSKAVDVVKNILTFDVQKELVKEGSTKQVMYNVVPPVSTVGAAVITTSALSKLVPASLGGKLAVGALAVPAAVAVVSHPSSVGEVAKGIVNVEGNLIKVAANPSAESVKELVTENPIIVGTAAATAVIFGVKAAIPAVTGLLTAEKVEEQTEAIREQTGVIKEIGTGGAGTTALVPEKAIATNEEIPVTTATTTIQTGKRRYRKAKAKEKPSSMRQSMQVLINNQNQRVNKNYIKRELLYN